MAHLTEDDKLKPLLYTQFNALLNGGGGASSGELNETKKLAPPPPRSPSPQALLQYWRRSTWCNRSSPSIPTLLPSEFGYARRLHVLSGHRFALLVKRPSCAWAPRDQVHVDGVECAITLCFENGLVVGKCKQIVGH